MHSTFSSLSVDSDGFSADVQWYKVSNSRSSSVQGRWQSWSYFPMGRLSGRTSIARLASSSGARTAGRETISLLCSLQVGIRRSTSPDDLRVAAFSVSQVPCFSSHEMCKPVGEVPSAQKGNMTGIYVKQRGRINRSKHYKGSTSLRTEPQAHTSFWLAWRPEHVICHARRRSAYDPCNCHHRRPIDRTLPPSICLSDGASAVRFEHVT